MSKVIGVRFKRPGKVYFFDAGNINVKAKDKVIVETAMGQEMGEVVINNKNLTNNKIKASLKPIIRVATEKDLKHFTENKEKEKEAFKICEEKIKKHKLGMHLVDASYTFDNAKLLFYFTADNRIDFRELVKDLASIFKTRIELRQIGVRDEAKSIGGLGPCGRKLCCSTWLGDFQPVSIKMAKDQSLSLNPTKISGICGRLFCCLKYEHDVYAEAIDAMPVVGALVKVDESKGKIIEVNPLLEQVRIEFNDKTIKVCHKDEVKVLHEPKKCCGCVSLKDEGLDEATLRELKKLED